MVEKRYWALRIVGTIYKVLGIIVGVVTVLLVLVVCLTSVIGGVTMDALSNELDLPTPGFGTVGGIFYYGVLLSLSLFLILYGGGLALTLFALGESVFLAIAVEENTRVTANLLQNQIARAAAPPTPPTGR